MGHRTALLVASSLLAASGTVAFADVEAPVLHAAQMRGTGIVQAQAPVAPTAKTIETADVALLVARSGGVAVDLATGERTAFAVAADDTGPHAEHGVGHGEPAAVAVGRVAVGLWVRAVTLDRSLRPAPASTPPCL